MCNSAQNSGGLREMIAGCQVNQRPTLTFTFVWS